MFDVKFIQALAYAVNREVVPGDEYYLQMTDIQRQMAVSIAGMAQVDQISHIIGQVNKAIDNGMTFNDWKKAALAGGFDPNLPDYRLQNIFRTNIQAAYNRGKWYQQQDNKKNRPYLIYDAINDVRTRPNHLLMDKVVRHIDDKFWDTHYPPCGYQCFLPGTQIQGDLQGAIVRTYQGVAVELTTNSNRRLSVTGNHPILTERGWVRADCLNVGDNVISYGLPVNGIDINNGSIQVNNDDAIPTVENLFDAFISKAFRFSGSSTLKFYSDIANGEIDVDVADDRLLLNVASDVLQSVEQVEFIRGYDGRFTIQAFESVSTSNLGATINDIVFAENTTDITMGAIKSFCELSLASVGCSVEMDNFSFEFCITGSNGFPSLTELSLNATRVLFDSLPLDRFGLALSSQYDTMFRELSTNGFSSEFGLFRYLVDTHSSQVFIDPVADIRKFDFSGHVYDFQSSEGILSSDGIISHNCRCSTRSLTEEQAKARGITSDEDLPDVEADSSNWGSTPKEYTEKFDKLVRSKISDLMIEYYQNAKSIDSAYARIKQSIVEYLDKPIIDLSILISQAEQYLEDNPDEFN